MKERRRWKTDWRRCKKECKRCKKEWSRSRGVCVEGSVEKVQGSACGRKCEGGAGECVWNEVWRMSR